MSCRQSYQPRCDKADHQPVRSSNLCLEPWIRSKFNGTLSNDACRLSMHHVGKLRCACTTPACHRDGTTTCQADNFCYVQVIPPVSASGARSPGDVTRGCIDDDTPLLCENKRPSMYRGAWPVLHCCSKHWCNRRVVPTLPPWASHVEGNQ